MIGGQIGEENNISIDANLKKCVYSLNNKKLFEFNSNKIQTAQYQIAIFLVQNLLKQFSKLLNIYYVIIGLLQIIPGISITGQIPFIYISLIIVLSISILKDFFENQKKKDRDMQENLLKVRVYRDNCFDSSNQTYKTTCQTLIPGELVKIYQNEQIPADIILLNTNEQNGVCYVDTKILDGETNLTIKQISQQLLNLTEDEIVKQKYELNTDNNSSFLYQFIGKLKFEGLVINLKYENFILRGCRLRINKYVIGMVAYTGHNTKLFLNSTPHVPKISQVERQMNKYTLIFLIGQIFLCLLISFIECVLGRANFNTQNIYLKMGKDFNLAYQILVEWGVWILITSNFIPICLICTMDFIKFVQALNISRDKETQTFINGQTIKTQVFSSNLNEELGQVQHIFADKTGTLTSNNLQFRCISIDGINYGQEEWEKATANAIPTLSPLFRDERLFQIVKDLDLMNIQSSQHQKVYDAFLTLSLCHNVSAEQQNPIFEQSESNFSPFSNDGLISPKAKIQTTYYGISPDEECLVNFAKLMEFEFLGTTKQIAKVNIKGISMSFEIVQVLEFDQQRKIMSIILRKDDNYTLYCKGADYKIQDKLEKELNQDHKNEIQTNLNNYYLQGFRTMTLAKREITQNELETLIKDLNDLGSQNFDTREEDRQKAYAKIEKNLKFIGTVAIEDQLQDEVFQSINIIKDNRINLWVLTGDRIVYTQNIAYSCGLLNINTECIIIGKKDSQIHGEKEIEQQICNANFHIDQNKNASQQIQYALVVTGDSLTEIIPSNKNQQAPKKKEEDTPSSENMSEEVYTLAQDFIQLADKCQVVLACELSPVQKAQIIQLVRSQNPELITLAIGDGANDVNMLKSAHIGVAIRGKEGIQATRVSDFSIGQFKVIKYLLFHHGRECYRKNTKAIYFLFQVSILLIFWQIISSFFNQLTGVLVQYLYIYQLYKIPVLFIAIVIYAIYDVQQTSYELLSEHIYYQQGRENLLFSTEEFWIQNFFGIWQGVICAFASFYCMEDSNTQNGYTNSMAISNETAFTCIIFIINAKILLISNVQSIFSILRIILSIALYVIFIAFLSNKNTFVFATSQSIFWLTLIIIVSFCIFIEMAFIRARIFVKDIREQRRLIDSQNKNQEFQNNSIYINSEEEGEDQINYGSSKNLQNGQVNKKESKDLKLPILYFDFTEINEINKKNQQN